MGGTAMPPPPLPEQEVDSVMDSYGYPITWSAVWSAHRALTLAGQSDDSDGDEWAWHPVAQEQSEARRFLCDRWPGPICPTCFAASCARCSYVFAAWDEARAVGDRGRLLCVACAPRGASLYDWMCSSDAALKAMDLGETGHGRRRERPWADDGPVNGGVGRDIGQCVGRPRVGRAEVLVCVVRFVLFGCSRFPCVCRLLSGSLVCCLGSRVCCSGSRGCLALEVSQVSFSGVYE